MFIISLAFTYFVYFPAPSTSGFLLLSFSVSLIAFPSSKIKAFIAKRQKTLAQFGKDSPSFHMWCNKVQASIKTCKCQFYERKVKSLKRTNVSRWWKEVKNISGISAKEDMWCNQLLDLLTPWAPCVKKLTTFSLVSRPPSRH